MPSETLSTWQKNTKHTDPQTAQMNPHWVVLRNVAEAWCIVGKHVAPRERLLNITV